jgi:hypothetical protein
LRSEHSSLKSTLIDLLQRETNSNNSDFRFHVLVLLLLNKKVDSFTIVPDTQHNEEQTWRALVSHCPRLQQLYYLRPNSRIVRVGPILGQLAQMEKLTVVHLDVAFDDHSLCILALSLPKLR